MQKSKLLDIFATLSTSELKLFKKFVRSPIYNQNKQVQFLSDYLAKYAPDFSPKKVNKQQIFKHLYPTLEYNDLKMRHLMSLLLKVAEQFLAYLDFQEQKINQQLHLLSAFKQRKLDRHFEHTLAQTQSLQAQNPYFDRLYFYHQYRLESEHSLYLESRQQRGIEPNLQPLANSLDCFYLINKLKGCCAMLSYQNLVNVDYQLFLMPDLLQYLKKNWTAYPAAVAIYYHTLLTLVESEQEAHFQQLKQLLHEHHDKFPPSELQDIYVLARNYCIKRLNQGDKGYLAELFDLYKKEIEQGTILENGYFPPLSFGNIVVVGLRLNAYEWVEDFIKNYKEKLPPDLRDNTFRYNLARLNFAQKNYQKVVGLLHQVAYDEMFTSLGAKTLLLKTYYELDEEEALFSLIDSFRAFLKRRQNIAYHRTNYLHFLKYVQQLVKIPKNDKERLYSLFQSIQNTKEIVDKVWLLEKLRGLL